MRTVLSQELPPLLSQWSDVDQHEASEVQHDTEWEIQICVSLQSPLEDVQVCLALDSSWQEESAMETSCNPLHGNPTPILSLLPPWPLRVPILFAPT
jgi:hypothetical protein